MFKVRYQSKRSKIAISSLKVKGASFTVNFIAVALLSLPFLLFTKC
jgi:hypothetical protein